MRSIRAWSRLPCGGGRMNQLQSDFLRNTVTAAQYTQKTYGVPASITLAQAILESGWGKSSLAQKCNNFFGVKAVAHATPDTYEEFPTIEFVDGRKTSVMAQFAKYPSPTLGFAAHARLLALAERYKPAMACRSDVEMFAEQLHRCGYSTNPNYAASLMVLVKEFDLTQYDIQPDPAAPAAEVA
ncbi:glucosaminidase domain-containing protein [Alloacidobacterium dinghuense]|uniref:Glucosaminidase domain-containing protein n=1 Tax=Alloacidobacterium dinghuense TaxID=2763107 RepID=A0A7G8BPP5_9BACT|nr:glucosaminidase domain-containing protein [Alloacidobacterium dinghuense]QNI34515.1 glucosaminidase domain-containing protein [Alloacidobacterium dinghuense]